MKHGWNNFFKLLFAGTQVKEILFNLYLLSKQCQFAKSCKCTNQVRHWPLTLEFQRLQWLLVFFPPSMCILV